MTINSVVPSFHLVASLHRCIVASLHHSIIPSRCIVASLHRSSIAGDVHDASTVSSFHLVPSRSTRATTGSDASFVPSRHDPSFHRSINCARAAHLHDAAHRRARVADVDDDLLDPEGQDRADIEEEEDVIQRLAQRHDRDARDDLRARATRRQNGRRAPSAKRSGDGERNETPSARRVSSNAARRRLSVWWCQFKRKRWPRRSSHIAPRRDAHTRDPRRGSFGGVWRARVFRG